MTPRKVTRVCLVPVGYIPKYDQNNSRLVSGYPRVYMLCGNPDVYRSMTKTTTFGTRVPGTPEYTLEVGEPDNPPEYNQNNHDWYPRTP